MQYAAEGGSGREVTAMLGEGKALMVWGLGGQRLWVLINMMRDLLYGDLSEGASLALGMGEGRRT